MLLSKSPDIIPEARFFAEAFEHLAVIYLYILIGLTLISVISLGLFFRYALQTKIKWLWVAIITIIGFCGGLFLTPYFLNPHIAFLVTLGIHFPLILSTFLVMAYLLIQKYVFKNNSGK